jgi:hypothetical protein
VINEFKVFFLLLKLGVLVNLYFLYNTFNHPIAFADVHLLIPAQIVFTVSTFRCLFPVNYVGNAVVHDSPFSSIFLTRFFATFSEIAMIYQIAYLLRLLNVDHVAWVNILSWLMVIQVIVSQGFVWGAILSMRPILYFYEELGWFLIFVFNTIPSAYMYMTVDNFTAGEFLIKLNLLFGTVYLPWQIIHLRSLRLSSQATGKIDGSQISVTWKVLVQGLARSIYIKNKTTQAKAWGGVIGIMWMTAYWVAVMPVWVYLIVMI